MGGLTYFNIGDKRINLTQVKKILANKTHCKKLCQYLAIKIFLICH